MAQELIYTSFPKGVKPGVSGFCTVAVSPDMAPNLISRLEGLSGYRHMYMPGTPEADLNPPNWSHVVISVGNAESHVVYRVADAGLDYTGRSNKLAHFIVLDKNDLAPCGPAAMLTTPGLIDIAFDQKVGTRPFTRPIPRQLVSSRPCMAWRQAAGDAGWAGELAQTAWTGKYACIVYKPGMNVLALIQEAMALLPPDRRWKTTFSTYYSKLPTGVECQWRCVVEGTPEAAQAIAEVGSGLVIDLSNGALAPAPDSPAVMAARAGRMVQAPAGTKPVAAATRKRPVQTARPAAEAAVNAGIQAELQTIDSADANSAEDDVFSKMDSLEWSASMSQNKQNTRPASGMRFGLFAAIIAGVILLGVIIASAFVLSNNSSKTAPVASNKDSSSQSAQSNDAQNPDVEAAVSDEEQQNADEQARLELEEQARLEAEQKAKQEAEEKARLEAEEKARLEAEEKARQAEQARLEAEQKAKKEAEEIARWEAARKKKDAEEKIFNDPRWVGTDRNQYFIYIDSNGVPDCARLNLQLQKQKLQIENLELVKLLNDNSGLAGFELKPNDQNPSKYDVLFNSFEAYVSFQVDVNQNELPTDASNSNDKPILSIDGADEPAFVDFVQQNALLVKFSDNSSRVISFFREDNAKSGELLSKAVMMPIIDKSSQYIFTVPAGIPDKKTVLVSEIQFVQNSKDSILVGDNEYKIKTVKDKAGFKIVVLGINHTLKEKVKNGVVVDTKETPIQDFAICFDKTNELDKFVVKYRFKKEREALSDEYSARCLSNEEFSSFIKPIVKSVIRDRVFYIDVSIQESRIDGCGPFLWKRIVLPSTEGSKK